MRPEIGGRRGERLNEYCEFSSLFADFPGDMTFAVGIEQEKDGRWSVSR